MAQRIVRAKRKISVARIPFRVPEADELAARLPGVLHVLYLIFTEGYAASSGDDLVRVDLTEESMRLARILNRLLPAESEVTGLLALFLLVDARRSARETLVGSWSPSSSKTACRGTPTASQEGSTLVVSALDQHPPGPYVLQAAIAAVHAEAADVATTDWEQIVALYELLLLVSPSPVVQLNRAVAVAMRDGPEVGLAALDAIEVGALRGYHLLPAARAISFADLEGRPKLQLPTGWHLTSWRTSGSGTSCGGGSQSSRSTMYVEVARSQGPQATFLGDGMIVDSDC